MLSCTKEESIEAERASTSKSWKELSKNFKLYAHCDDGSIAEGFSESVSVLLAEDWKNIDQLGMFVKFDPAFYKFVIRHVDATAPIERLERITKNAAAECPKKLEALCQGISVAAFQAIKESK